MSVSQRQSGHDLCEAESKCPLMSNFKSKHLDLAAQMNSASVFWKSDGAPGYPNLHFNQMTVNMLPCKPVQRGRHLDSASHLMGDEKQASGEFKVVTY